MITTIRSDLLMSKSAEGAVLGSMILDSRCIPAVLELLTVESFTFSEHRAIFAAILSVWQRHPGAEIDGVLLRNALEGDGDMDDAGGVEYLKAVIESVPTAANARYYARQVRERQRYRETLAAVDSMRGVLAEGGSVDGIIEQVQALALGLECQTRETNVFHVKDHATNVAVASQDERNTIGTGYANIDRLLNGVSDGDLVYVAGRPSMGKTSLGCGWALNAAAGGKPVVFFTLEMTGRALIERFCSMLGQVSLTAVKQRRPPQDILNRFYAGSIELEKLPITIIENIPSVEPMQATVRQLKQAGPVELVIIDYLGLMSPPGGKNRSRNDELTEISRGLKRMAQTEHVPVVALSQLNRAVETRENHRPRMSDLRDSGSLEQDADAVILLHREDYYRKLADPRTKDLDGLAEAIVAKSRNGPTGVAQLVFLEEQMRFVNLMSESSVETAKG